MMQEPPLLNSGFHSSYGTERPPDIQVIEATCHRYQGDFAIEYPKLRIHYSPGWIGMAKDKDMLLGRKRAEAEYIMAAVKTKVSDIEEKDRKANVRDDRGELIYSQLVKDFYSLRAVFDSCQQSKIGVEKYSKGDDDHYQLTVCAKTQRKDDIGRSGTANSGDGITIIVPREGIAVGLQAVKENQNESKECMVNFLYERALELAFATEVISINDSLMIKEDKLRPEQIKESQAKYRRD